MLHDSVVVALTSDDVNANLAAVEVGKAPKVTVTAPPELIAHEGPFPLQPSPLQPVIEYPDAGTALSVVVVPKTKSAEHDVGQLIAPVELVTDPDPCTTTDTRYGGALKVAVTDAAPVTVQVPVPEHAPPHPSKWTNENTDVGAVSVTVVPVWKTAEQVVPQLIPLGLLVTLPGPFTDTDTLKKVGKGWGGTFAWCAAAPLPKPKKSPSAANNPSTPGIHPRTHPTS
jgi:hypothetical protein